MKKYRRIDFFGRSVARPLTGLSAVALLASVLLGSAMVACNDTNGAGDSNPADVPSAANDTASAGNNTETAADVAPPLEVALTDVATPDVALADVEAVDDGMTSIDTSTTQDASPSNPCATATCAEANRSVCITDSAAPGGYRCDCDTGFALDGGVCVDATCDDERATTAMTIIDTTALADTTNPVRSGFDPLVKGDSVRVVVDFAREDGNRPVKLQISLDNLEILPISARIDGTAVSLLPAGSNRFELELPADQRSGQLVFDGTIPPNGPGLVAAEARLATRLGCRVVGSASGARIQLTGSVNPKHAVCNDLGDMRSLQISTGVFDKNTTVYEERNGSFTDISDTFKILTQMTLCIQRPADVTVSLAGSADGTRPWTIDNFLLIEVFNGDPAAPTTQRIDAWITTSWSATAPSRYADNTPIRMLSHASLPGDYTGSRTPSPFSFPAGTVQLNTMLPAGQRTWLRLTGLDSGVAGHLSRLFIHASAPGETVAECRSHRDCPRDNSFDGLNTQIRAGCIGGRCTPVSCATTACPLGQTCLQGFCTESCTSDNGCPTGQVCGHGGVCTTVGNGGCKTFSDCPTGEVCFFGRCESGCFHPVGSNPNYTENNTQWSLCRLFPAACPRCGDASTRCWNNYCRNCEIDAHCPSGQRCRASRCVTP